MLEFVHKKRNIVAEIAVFVALVFMTALFVSAQTQNSAEMSEYEAHLNTEILYSGTCGENLTWTIDKNKVLTIGGTGKMTDWASSLATPWYSNRTFVSTLVIEDGVTSIGNYAFGSLSNNLTDVTIGNSVTTIGTRAFEYCKRLTDITIPDSVVKINGLAFSGCNGVKSVVFGEGVSNIGNGAFIDCTSLISVEIPSSTTSIGMYAFRDCTSLT